MRQAVWDNRWNLYNAAVMDAEGIHTLQFQPANACNDSYSVAKLFTVTALGMLWDDKSCPLMSGSATFLPGSSRKGTIHGGRK
ncbi:MAG: hypothetical protein ACLR23_15565 [Clostridia bacterium]